MEEKNSIEDSMSVLDLISLKAILDECQVPTVLLEKSDVMPLSSLVVNLNDDHKDRTRTLSFSFVPLDAEYFPDIKIMQAYSEFNFEIAPEQLTLVEHLVITLNKLLAVGSMGISDSNTVYYRYVHTIGKYKSLKDAEAILLNLMDLIQFGLDVNSEILESVALGEKSFDEALAEFMA